MVSAIFFLAAIFISVVSLKDLYYGDRDSWNSGWILATLALAGGWIFY